MIDSVASYTALRVAVRRAEHQVLDHPLVFEDHLSLRILDPANAAKIQPGVISRRQNLYRSFRAFMAVRSRFAEDELAKAVASGVRQYIILGAGLDTFAYRNPHETTGLRVFEVDHPATQAWKRAQLQAAVISEPPSLTFVPVDLERETLPGALRDAGFRFDLPAWVSWLGVVPYMSRRVFEATIGLVASLPATSGIVFDYAVPRQTLNPVEQLAMDALSTRVANAGEPFQLFLDTRELAVQLREIGFGALDDLGREEMNARYFTGRDDGFRVKGNWARLVVARTGVERLADRRTHAQ